MRWLPLLLVACSSADFLGGSPSGGGFGATPGGVKDLGDARRLMAAGTIPPPEAFLVEAGLSEHDLPIPGEPCARTLCVRATSGRGTDAQGNDAGWIQIGLSSSVDPDTWEAPPTTFIYTIDVSGSMAWSQIEEASTPGTLARKLLRQLLPRVRDQDRIAIVTYGDDAEVRLPLRPGSERAAGLRVVEALAEDGSTNMEAGLRVAYEIGRAAKADGQTPNVRVVLFTDAQPNVGATTPTEFQRIVGQAGDAGIGLTVIGLGVGLDPATQKAMAHLRGANAFTAFTDADLTHFLEESYPWFSAPIAHDLSFVARPAGAARLGVTFGFPEGTAGSPGLEVSSVFLSKKRGALLFTVKGDADAAVDLGLRYVTAEGYPVEESLAVAAGADPVSGSLARARAIALVLIGMRESAAAYAKDPALAEQIMRAAHERLLADSEGDETLAPEREMAARLLELIVSRARQGTLYGA